ncbi:MAG: leucine-rich repeat protein [Christensenella sp.]|nr:leucine-rich repeat protein [Christensenella sp.]
MDKLKKFLLNAIFILCISIVCLSAYALGGYDDYKAYDGDDWSMSANGVLTIESNQGWANCIRDGYKPEVKELVIGKDVTYFRMYSLPEDLPSPDFFDSFEVEGYDKNGEPYYNYNMYIELSPLKITVEAGNQCFRVVDGLLINTETSELVLSEMGVTDVVIPEGVKVITRDAFYERDLTSVQFPSSLERIGQYAFARCENLRSVDLPDSLTQLERGAFSMSTSLKDVSLPIGLKKIEAYTFDDCAIYQIVIPENVEEVGAWAFFECDQLVQVDLPDDLRTIQEYAFSGCTRLLRINFPIGLESIGGGAFFDCSNLKYIFIPDSLKQAGNGIFSDCNLSVLRIPASLAFPVYDRDKGEYIVNPNTKKDKTFGLSSADTVIFSGSDYDFGYPAINNAKNVYFLGKPPEDVGQILDRDTTGKIYCSEEYEHEWTRSTVASWVRQKIQFLPADQINEITQTAINTTPRPIVTPKSTPTATSAPANTPQPVTSPTPELAAETNETTDPLLYAFVGILALVIAGIVVVAMNNRNTKKRSKKK